MPTIGFRPRLAGYGSVQLPGSFIFVVRAGSGVFPGQEVSSGEPLRLSLFFSNSGYGGERSSRSRSGSEPRGKQARLGWEAASPRKRARGGAVDWETVEIDDWMKWCKGSGPGARATEVTSGC